MSSNNDEELNQLIERDKRAKKSFLSGIYLSIYLCCLLAHIPSSHLSH